MLIKGNWVHLLVSNDVFRYGLPITEECHVLFVKTSLTKKIDEYYLSSICETVIGSDLFSERLK